jgi:hypothetical protein
LFPFGVSFLLPIFVIILVKEKEDRILIMMQMNGLKPWAYYLTHFIHFYTLHLISSAIFLLSGWIAEFEMFTQTDLNVLWTVFAVWGLDQVALAFFFSSFFSKTRTALGNVFVN